MKKKNLLTILVAVALVAALAVGATLAYFTDKDSASNTFTMGKVAIDLQESDNGETWVEDGLEYTGVMPGNTETKIAKVTVADDSSNCYLQIQAVITSADLSAEDLASITDQVVAAIGSDWTVVQAGNTLTCTYNTELAANDAVTLFSSIEFPTTFGNSFAGKSFGIELNAYAIQAANMTLDTAAWDYTTFEAA
ncbi:MAG: TasA family protein [Oscillospiraceae bacterium]|nr:TasA family protein [Oscillospiraceae bacterium]